jgi:hypothetical protein
MTRVPRSQANSELASTRGRRDQQRQAPRDMLLAGAASPPAAVADDDWFAHLRARIRPRTTKSGSKLVGARRRRRGQTPPRG